MEETFNFVVLEALHVPPTFIFSLLYVVVVEPGYESIVLDDLHIPLQYLPQPVHVI